MVFSFLFISGEAVLVIDAHTLACCKYLEMVYSENVQPLAMLGHGVIYSQLQLPCNMDP